MKLKEEFVFPCADLRQEGQAQRQTSTPPESRDTRRGKSTLHFVRGEGLTFAERKGEARATIFSPQGAALCKDKA